MENAWDSTVRNLGISGMKWLFPEEKIPKAKQMGLKSPLEKFIEKLRSGEDMPASAALILADIIEGAYPYKLQLMPVKRNIARADHQSDIIGVGLELERIQRDHEMSLNHAVAHLAEYLDVDDRTVWRHWSAYKDMYPKKIFQTDTLSNLRE